MKADVHFGMEVGGEEGGVLGLRVSGVGVEREGGIRGGGGVWLPGTRWDFFRDREAGIRYVARLFPIP